MATQSNELYLKNKNRSKRNAGSAVFTIVPIAPGGVAIPDGSHIIGKLEGNVVITRVIALVTEGFPTGATATLTDNNGNTYFTTADLVVPVVNESVLTANAATLPDPIYAAGVTEFTADVVSLGSTVGEVMFIVDYAQLDTVTGKHTK